MSAVSKNVTPFGEGGVDDRSGALEVDAPAEVVAAQSDDGDVEPRVAERASGKVWHPAVYSIPAWAP